MLLLIQLPERFSCAAVLSCGLQVTPGHKQAIKNRQSTQAFNDLKGQQKSGCLNGMNKCMEHRGPVTSLRPLPHSQNCRDLGRMFVGLCGPYGPITRPRDAILPVVSLESYGTRLTPNRMLQKRQDHRYFQSFFVLGNSLNAKNLCLSIRDIKICFLSRREVQSIDICNCNA